MKIVIPKRGPKALYYNVHVMYFRKLLDYLKIPYILQGMVGSGRVKHPCGTKFLVEIDNKSIVIDFSDHTDFLSNWDTFHAYFKYHYSRTHHDECSKIYSFAPVSFYNWEQYLKLGGAIKYTCNSDIILNMQRPGGNALERRQNVQEMLNSIYPGKVVIQSISQLKYWEKINDCLVHVFVPGARNNMVDRGHMQYLAFGCCTIAPPIQDVFPYNEQIKPGLHYVECKADYSDLPEKIEWCRRNRKVCVNIGNRAKKLFERACTPNKLWEWILRCSGI